MSTCRYTDQGTGCNRYALSTQLYCTEHRKMVEGMRISPDTTELQSTLTELIQDYGDYREDLAGGGKRDPSKFTECLKGIERQVLQGRLDEARFGLKITGKYELRQRYRSRIAELTRQSDKLNKDGGES